jgi:uncharacterized protein GlcG (DUF336 family)
MASPLARLSCFACLLFAATSATAQEPTPYGQPVSLDAAKKIAAAAAEKANAEKWPLAIAIVDSGGHLVLFHRLDNTQLGSVEVAIEKAKTAVLYRRPTKALEDRIAKGGADLKLLKLPGMPLEGGIPIVQDGKIIGGIGVSGMQSPQDAAVAQAGLKSLAGNDKGR